MTNILPSMRPMMDNVADPHWHEHAEEALACRSTGWFQRKFEQYDRERGYRNDVCGLVYVVLTKP